MSPTWNNDLFDRVKNNEIEIVENNEVLGDETLITVKRERQASGKYYVWYDMEFRLRNVWTQVSGQGMESDVSLEYLMQAAKAVLE